MIDIGTFKTSGDGYIGTLTTLHGTVELTFEPLNSNSDKAPDFTIQHNGREVGGAWRRQSKSGNAFLSVSIQDPSYPCPIRAALFQPRQPKSLDWPLVWDRSGTRD